MSTAAAVTVEDLRPELWADPWWRLCNLYHIVNERNEVVRFVPNDEQRQLYDNLHYRNLILKARQLGFTTFICILALDQCLFNTNFSAGIIAHNREDAEKFFRNKVIFAYDRLPKPRRASGRTPSRRRSSRCFSARKAPPSARSLRPRAGNRTRCVAPLPEPSRRSWA